MLLSSLWQYLSFIMHLSSREHSGLPAQLRPQAPDEKKHQQTPLEAAAHCEIKRGQSCHTAAAGLGANSKAGCSCSLSKGCLQRHIHRLHVQRWTGTHPTKDIVLHILRGRKGTVLHATSSKKTAPAFK